MKSPVVRIDFHKESYTFNLNSLSHLSFVPTETLSGKSLKIKLAFDNEIVISAYGEEQKKELEREYLNLYTKWKMLNQEREDEREVLVEYYEE